MSAAHFQKPMQTYDFIVIGAGSAGSVVAERLSANGRFSVLVLEAGGTDRRFFVQMPLGYGKTFFDPAVNWNYRAEPDPGLAGNADHWPRGKLLGGSSSINAMVWIRGHPRGLRRLARGRKSRLGLRRPVAGVQGDRGQPGRR